jgi:soluble lytic murein transglycosylase-like protein
MVTIDQLVSVALTSSGPFAACADYFDKFDTYGSQYGLPPILLASIALQESSCDPSVTGGNGEAGLMQLASGNCADAPDGK